GKIDRQALPLPSQRTAASPSPLSAHEQRFAGIWEALLGQHGVGADADFFALGGHSLLATRLASQIRDVFDADVPLRTLFANSTLRAQAVAIAAMQTTTPEHSPIAILERRDRLPLSFAQERLWFLDQLEPGSSAYNMAGALRLSGDVDLDALRDAFAHVMERHEVLRTVFPMV